MDIPTNMVLQTERLLLRFPKLEDSEKIISIVRLPNFPARLPLKEMSSTNDIKDWLKRLQEGWVKGQVFSWIVEELDSGQMVGQVTLSKVAGDNRWALALRLLFKR
jgi:RimJ/RimL family protein N-acetyltransferase